MAQATAMKAEPIEVLLPQETALDIILGGFLLPVLQKKAKSSQLLTSRLYLPKPFWSSETALSMTCSGESLAKMVQVMVGVMADSSGETEYP